MKNESKHYTAEEKVAILRRHLLDKVPVSEVLRLWLGAWLRLNARSSSAINVTF